jgi:predicted TIM-barrel fold metal-dependent hydrolase
MTIDLASVEAIDVHVHAEVGRAGEDGMRPEWRAAAGAYFGEHSLPTADEVAAFYRERSLAAVIFTVDAETATGRKAVRNEEIAEVAAANADVLISFASVDPNKRKQAVEEAKRLVRDHGVRGFEFHSNVQAFFPNDKAFSPFYEVIAEAGLPRSSIPAIRGSDPVFRAAAASASSTPTRCTSTISPSTPELTIVLAHPSFPWQDEALSVALHK